MLAIRRFRSVATAIAVLNSLWVWRPSGGADRLICCCRVGPFCVLGLLFTPRRMISSPQVDHSYPGLLLPSIFTLRRCAIFGPEYHDLLISLNTRRRRRILTLTLTGGRALLTAALAGFCRAIRRGRRDHDLWAATSTTPPAC